ncbi:MAG TPA: GNAT family N-acetyltransferase, partial [Burkholderiaceae bacterium]|nr:GNAT family N-acetyltransferase [Burkholderiaceae bacterium]
RRFTLRDGRVATIRAIAPADAAEIIEAFARLSSESRYMRFGEHKKTLDPECVDRSTRPVPGREFAIVATTPAAHHEGFDIDEGFDIVGVAHYVPAHEREDTCEFGVTVADDWQQGGLATTLMRSLIRRAQRDGFHAIEGEVLASNAAMLALARHLRFRIAPVPGDATRCSARRELRRRRSS